MPSLLTQILNTLAYQNNTMCRQNSKTRVEEDAVMYENKQHMDEECKTGVVDDMET